MPKGLTPWPSEAGCHTAETDRRVAAVFGALDVETLSARLMAADIAFARVSDMADLAAHPHLRRITIASPSGPISSPAPAAVWAGERRQYGAIPALGEHTELIRAEFMRSQVPGQA